MHKNKNILLLVLMISSIILLLVLQAFWIRSEYKSAEEAFRRETNLVFRSTISGLLDSLYMTRVEFLNEDSTVQFPRRRFNVVEPEDSLAIVALGKAIRLNLNKSTIVVTQDSLRKSHNVAKGRPRAVQSLMIRVNPDSLDIGSIENRFNANLQDFERKTSFKILEKDADKLNHSDTSSYVTDFIRIGPSSERKYAASFEKVPLLLLNQVYPQIIFCFILTLLITGAFIVMYRNLRMQQRLSMQKDDFINNVSHELKTPIATVNVAFEAFKNFKVLENPKMTTDYIDIIKSELDRLSFMTERILNASLYENKGIEVNDELIDVNKTVYQAVKASNITEKRSGTTIDFTSEGTDFTITGSREHLTNVVHNLIDNAVKYSSSPARIIVRLIDDKSHVVIIVKDQGIGIPEEYRKKIFEKFFRVPHGDVHNVKGYGLGLSYVAQVVKAHKGIIYVDSQLDRGSTFTIKLPKNVQD